MKKQTAAVMSAVTLISSIVPIAPVSALENQEALEEMVEQTTEHVEGAIASSEILQEGNGIISEEVETVTEEIKEDAVNTELLEEVTSDINVESNEGEKIEVEDEEVFEEEIVENMEELPSNEVTEDVIETENTENEMPESTTEENTEELPSNEVTEDVIETENTEDEMPESTTEENTEEAIKVEQEIETNIQSGNMTENSQEGEKTQESITDEQEEVEIPDAFLKAIINEALGRPEDPTHAVTNFEMQSITELYGSRRGISNLEGLEYATKLSYLDLSYNEITDFNPISDLKDLTYLDLSSNKITDLEPLGNLTNLIELNLWDNLVSDFSSVEHVESVWAEGQTIYLETQEINKEDDVTIKNPLVGKIVEDYIDITVPYGSYDKETNQITWEDVTNYQLKFTFQGNNVSGTVIVPIRFIGEVEEFVNIPDVKLQAIINTALGRPKDPTHTVTNFEMQSITELEGSFEDISNLEGLEYATKLSYLDLSFNEITNLNPISNLKDLKYLDLSANNITNLNPISNLKNLTHLDLSMNKITDLNPISNLKDLTYLDLFDNKITDLNPISNLKNLTNLDLDYNHLSDIEPLSSLTNLKQLDLSFNEITNLNPISNLKNLTKLYLSRNKITDLNPISNLKNLTNLDLDYNHLSDIDPLSNLSNLTNLSLDGNQISDFSAVDNVESVSAQYQTIYLEVQEINKGESITINNPLLGKTFEDDVVINVLQGNYNQENNQMVWEDITKHYVNFTFESGEVSGLVTVPIRFIGEIEEVINIPDTELQAVINEVLGRPQDPTHPITNYEMESITELNADSRGISNLEGLQYATDLTHLSLYDNNISDLKPLDSLKFLEYLIIEQQEIKLDPVYIQQDETVTINNPLVGDWWMMKDQWSGMNIYEYGFNIENGYYDSKNNQFVWENIITDSLTINFSNTRYSSYEPGTVIGTITIPVIFYEIPENFTDFATNDIFNIIGGTGKLDDPLVLQVVEGTDVETIRSELAKYSDYDLSVTKPVTKERTAMEVESYVLTFSKGEEKVIFKVQVPVTETEVISYLNSLINQSTGGGETTPPAGGETTPPAGGETTPPAGGETTPPVGGETTPPAGEETTPPTGGSSDSSENPETGFTGLMGMIGLGTLSLGAVFSKRKKK